MRVVIIRYVLRIGIIALTIASVMFRLGGRVVVQTTMNRQSLRLFDVRHLRRLNFFAKCCPRRHVAIIGRSPNIVVVDFIATPNRPSLARYSIPYVPTRSFLHRGHGQTCVLSVNIFQLVYFLRRSPSTHFAAAASHGSSPGEVETRGYDIIPDGSSPSGDGTVEVYPNRTNNRGARSIAGPREQ